MSNQMLTEQTYETLFRKERNRVVRAALGILGDDDLAEEVVQEAYARLWERRGTIRNPSSARAFLMTTVSRLALNSRRDLRRHREQLRSFAPPSTRVPSPWGRPTANRTRDQDRPIRSIALAAATRDLSPYGPSQAYLQGGRSYSSSSAADRCQRDEYDEAPDPEADQREDS